MSLRTLPRIDRLDLAVLRLPDWHPAAELGRSVPVHGFVVHHPDGPILVDTGVGHDNAFIDELYGDQRSDLDAALGACGVRVEDVRAVINSHLHFDHCGQNPLLHDTGASFFVQRAEVRNVEDVQHYTVPEWALGPIKSRRELAGDETVAEGVTILATPGHTAGHQSVLVEGGGERIVIGGQLVWHASELDAEVASHANVDPDDELRAAAIDSIRRVKALRPSVVHLSHCAPWAPGTTR